MSQTDERPGREVQLPLPSRVAHTTVRQTGGLGPGHGGAGYSLNANGMLHREALHGHTEVVEKLLRMKQGEEVGIASFQPTVDVNGYDDQGQIPLLCAASGGHTETCKILLEYKADINLRKQNNGLSALHYACEEGMVETAQLLVAHGADINAAAQVTGDGGRMRGDLSTPLHSAAVAGQTEMVSKLLSGMVYNDVELQAELDKKDGAGQTALHRAAGKGGDDIIRILLDCGADLEAQDNSGETALFHAISNRRIPAVEALLEYGADANAVSAYGQTPMRICAGVIHRLKTILIAGGKFDRQQQVEEQEVSILMECLTTHQAVLDPKDRFFDLGVPSHLAGQSLEHFERLRNQAQGFGFITNAVADEQRLFNQTRGFGYITDLEVEGRMRDGHFD
eukprot:CAMPEP_0181292754 /NCGR_PEP_ID=MMETSP1101-20121128/2687_1 /TAXON_ID=46948 /ORGANISM="Rhodomonas abbreviata, Strain Caron Lab Isolate" /LENGTH=394 /DNA_ID=CAMNT_0023397269 /DNA_START=157 /DNA_END=1341 /DNA_ORIENTATION=+